MVSSQVWVITKYESRDETHKFWMGNFQTNTTTIDVTIIFPIIWWQPSAHIVYRINIISKDWIIYKDNKTCILETNFKILETICILSYISKKSYVEIIWMDRAIVLGWWSGMGWAIAICNNIRVNLQSWWTIHK